MTTEEYYIKKKEITDIEVITEEQKQTLIMALRIEYYGMDRSGLNHLNTNNFKQGMIQVI